MSLISVFEGARADIRLAFRALTARPGFTAVTLASLALGVGVCAIAFSVALHVHFRPLPFREPMQLVEIIDDAPDLLTSATADAWSSELERITAVSRWRAFQGVVRANTDAVRLSVAAVDTAFFRVLDIDSSRGAGVGLLPYARGMLLSHEAWQERFGSDSALVGKKLLLDETPFTVVGIMPASVTYPGGTDVWVLDHDVVYAADRRAYTLIARAATPSALQQIQAASSVLSPLEAPEGALRSHAIVRQLAETLRPKIGKGTLGLLAGSLCLLIVATVNTLTLFVGRAIERRHGMAVRVALGCSSFRLMRLFVAEAALLGVTGGIAGFAIAIGLHQVIEGIGWLHRVRLDDLQVGAPGLVVAIVLGLGSASVAAVLPSFLIRNDVGVLLKDARAERRRSLGGARGVLVVVEVALAFVFGVAAVILGGIYAESQRAQLAFRVDGVYFASVALPDELSAVHRQAIVRDLLTRVRASPMVGDAALWGTFFPNSGRARDRAISLEGNAEPRSYSGSPSVSFDVSTGFFRAMELQIVEGRAFDESDSFGSERVVILTKSAANRLWSGQAALGRRLKLGPPAEGGEWMTVVGVVENTQPLHALAGRYAADGVSGAALMFRPLSQGKVQGQSFASTAGFALAVVPRASAMDISQPVREMIQASHPGLVVEYLGSYREYLNRGGDLDLGKMVSQTALLTCMVAIALALVGIAAVLGEAIKRRRHEFGIRLALGAPPRELTRLIVTDASRLVVVGIGVGAFLAALVLMTVGASVVRDGGASQGSVLNADVLNPAAFLLVATTIIALALCVTLIQARAIASIHPSLALAED